MLNVNPHVRFALWLTLMAGTARAELVVVANDNKTVISPNGGQVVRPNAPADSLSVIDLASGMPKLVAEIEGVPTTVIGPPATVALTPNEQIALVLSARKVDPANPTRQIADNRMSVIDLTTKPPSVIATVETGSSPSGVSINREGTMALVGNSADGTIWSYTIAGKTVTPAGSMKLADPNAGVRLPALAPDGKRAFVTRDGDSLVTVVNVDGTTVKAAGQNIRSGFKPYVIDVSRDGTFAVVGNVGSLNYDTDTVGLIDIKSSPPRAVDIVAVGQTPEGLRLSPDGSLCAVVCTNGSSKAPNSPLFHADGRLLLFRTDGMKFTKVAEAPIGGWPQMAVISRDNKTILASSMTEQCVHVFRWDGKTLTDTKQPIKLKGSPASMGTAPFGGK